MAAVIAISIKMVGLLLITGMLIIPAAMARNISDSPQKMVLFSIIGGLLIVIANKPQICSLDYHYESKRK